MGRLKLNSNQWISIFRLLRPHQWVKNILVFVPILASHQVQDMHLLWQSTLSFLALSFLASGAYIINDFIDLESDRAHPTKKNRPLAMRSVSTRMAFVCATILIILGTGLSATIHFRVALGLMVYFSITLSYSLWFKRVALLDVLALAGLYIVRIFIGSIATGIFLSNWLLSFSLFIFTSLAFLKRFVELKETHLAVTEKISGRGYRTADLSIVQTLGGGSGLVSVLVLALYVDQQQVSQLYTRPNLLWTLCPLILYWISNIWLLAGRGLVSQDPVLFAVRDRTTYLVTAFFLLTMYWAS